MEWLAPAIVLRHAKSLKRPEGFFSPPNSSEKWQICRVKNLNPLILSYGHYNV